MIVALYAAVAMVIQDVLGTLLTQAEARNKEHLSAWLDCLGWIAAISTTSISVTALQGHDFGLKVAVVVCVSAANYFGTLLGVKLGKKFIRST